MLEPAQHQQLSCCCGLQRVATSWRLLLVVVALTLSASGVQGTSWRGAPRLHHHHPPTTTSIAARQGLPPLPNHPHRRSRGDGVFTRRKNRQADRVSFEEEDEDDEQRRRRHVAILPRGGGPPLVDGSAGAAILEELPSLLDSSFRLAFNALTWTFQNVLPPTVATVKTVAAFYATLSVDAILAQAGLVYCFAGGYFPTLFAAVQAAEQCGWEIMVAAVSDLTDEALAALDAMPKGWYAKQMTARQLFLEQARVVLATVDPVKVNQALAALYTTWLGISAVLEREFARTIALAGTIGDCIRPVANFVIGPAAYKVVPNDYHKWVPFGIGWTCKAAAMSIAWRIQRVLTAWSSAISGGLLCSRSVLRLLRRRGVTWFGMIPEDVETSVLDEVLGYSLAAAGLYAQIGNGFSFKIPFPLTLVTWPFQLLENWIQWQITKM